MFRTAAFLMKHLSLLSVHDAKTGMNCKNLSIVWAPNLLKFVFTVLFVKIVVSLIGHWFLSFFKFFV